MSQISKGLYIVSTPIGNLEDITFRSIRILKKSDIILCEDTRRTLKLLNHYKIKKKLISYHKFNERKELHKVIKYLKLGNILSLVSDAGTPNLSDPGRILIKKCISENIDIFPIPGPSSITAAMSVSGFDDKFLFYGFLPKTEGETSRALSKLSAHEYTQIFFVTAQKINMYLKKFREFFGGRKIMIAKELTKIHESFYRNEIDKIKLFDKKLKGELTIVISESNKKIPIDKEKIINKAKKYLKKYSVKDTVDLIIETEKINKKEIYNLCLKIKNE